MFLRVAREGVLPVHREDHIGIQTSEIRIQARERREEWSVPSGQGGVEALRHWEERGHGGEVVGRSGEGYAQCREVDPELDRGCRVAKYH